MRKILVFKLAVQKKAPIYQREEIKL